MTASCSHAQTLQPVSLVQYRFEFYSVLTSRGSLSTVSAREEYFLRKNGNQSIGIEHVKFARTVQTQSRYVE